SSSKTKAARRTGSCSAPSRTSTGNSSSSVSSETSERNDRMSNYQGEATMTKRGIQTLVVALASASLMVMATSAQADVKCRSAVVKGSASATQAMAKALQKCEQGVHDGKISGTCAADLKTQGAIQKASDKLSDSINKACADSTGEFAFGRCPNETGAD